VAFGMCHPGVVLRLLRRCGSGVGVFGGGSVRGLAVAGAWCAGVGLGVTPGCGLLKLNWAGGSSSDGALVPGVIRIEIPSVPVVVSMAEDGLSRTLWAFGLGIAVGIGLMVFCWMRGFVGWSRTNVSGGDGTKGR